MMVVIRALSLQLGLAFWFVCVVQGGIPGQGEPLTLVRGQVVEVETVSELVTAVNAANDVGTPATILVADGEYILNVPMLHVTCPGLVVRGASGDREAVVLRGPDEGPEAALAHVFLVGADDVVIADLTLGYCRYHGIQVQGEAPHDVSGLWVHNCHLINCNEQFIKGSSRDDDPVGATDGRIEDCLFEFSAGYAYQYYTGGIDIHKGVNWTVRRNRFRNLRVPDHESNIAEHAIHFWKRCSTQPQNIVVEQNWIINCDRGIGLGLGGRVDTGFNGGVSVIRNNFVYNDGVGRWTDVGIGLENADGVSVDNNTVVIEGYWAPIEYRWPGSSNLVFRNNLVNGSITKRDGAPGPLLSTNLERIESEWFVDLPQADLHLTSNAIPVIEGAISLAGFGDDIDGDPRPQQSSWDIGADEYSPAPLDADHDGLPDNWETDHGLDPSDSIGVHGATGDPDEDRFDNRSEYEADTDPLDSASYLAMIDPERVGEQWTVRWRGGRTAAQQLERLSEVDAQARDWEVLMHWAPPTPVTNSWLEEASASTRQVEIYRVRAWRPGR